MEAKNLLGDRRAGIGNEASGRAHCQDPHRERVPLRVIDRGDGNVRGARYGKYFRRGRNVLGVVGNFRLKMG